MTSVIDIALPVFAIIAAGLLAGRAAIMERADAAVLNKFVFRVTMPAALFGLTSTTAPPALADLAICLAYGAAALAVMVGAYFFSQTLFRLSPNEAGAHAFSSTLGNAVFLGLPIALTIDGWARPYVMLMLVEGVVIIALAAGMMAPRSAKPTSPLAFAMRLFSGPAKNPLVVAALAGIFLSAVGLTPPAPATAFFRILGAAAGPTALFSLGLFLATNPLPDVKKIAGRIAAVSVAKMAALPALAIGGALLLGVSDPAQLGALSLFTLVPTGVGAFVMASQYGFYASESAAAVTVTTAISVLTVSGVLIWFA